MNLILLILTIFIGFEVKSNEPFVILEYNGADFTNSNQNKINRNNKFLKNKNHTTMHKVKEGESLSGILHKYYGNSGLNMRIIEVSVIEINKHAFVRNNPRIHIIDYLSYCKTDITNYIQMEIFLLEQSMYFQQYCIFVNI